MTTIIDSHVHCFPPLGTSRNVTHQQLTELQHHVRFHSQGIRRVRDGAQVESPLLAGEKDGISFIPDLNFRIGRFGKLEFTHENEDYYIQWYPADFENMSISPELMISQMDYAGVDRGIIQHDRIYGRLDDFLSDCVNKYPDRFIALAQINEWEGGEEHQLERLRHQIEDLNHSGLYFSTGGFFHCDFQIGINDKSLKPLWDLVTELDIPIHWYAAKIRKPFPEDYLEEIRDLIQWAETYPEIRSVLTHGLNNVHYDIGKAYRFSVPPEIITLLNFPKWHMELMLHLMAGDLEFPPHEKGLEDIVKSLISEVGPEKLVWGSDMPACERTLTYKQSLILLKDRCDFLTIQERDMILGENLNRIYPLRI